MLGTDRDIDIFDSAATRELNLAKKTTNAAANIWFLVSVSQNRSRGVSVTRSAQQSTIRNTSTDWETELFTDISLSWPEYSTSHKTCCVVIMSFLAPDNAGFCKMLITSWSRSSGARQSKVGPIKKKSEIRKWKARGRYISVDWVSPSKKWNCSVSSGGRCQRETLAVPIGIMALNSLIRGEGWSAPGWKTAVCTQTGCLRPIQEPFPKDLQIHKGWHPTPTLRTAGPSGKVASWSRVFK